MVLNPVVTKAFADKSVIFLHKFFLDAGKSAGADCLFCIKSENMGADNFKLFERF